MLNGDETHEGTETKNCENVKTDEMEFPVIDAKIVDGKMMISKI